MQIGYSQAVITPKLEPPVYMAGFAHNRIAQSVHDDLYARDAHILDEELLVMQFLDQNLQVAISLFNFACHP